MFNKLADLQMVAFHLETINSAQKKVAAEMKKTDAFERGMFAGYENTTTSVEPYIIELTQLVAELQEYFEKPYMIDDLTYEGGDEVESA